MKKVCYIAIMIISFIIFNVHVLAEEDKIILNEPKMNDTNHTFQYDNLKINDNIKPYSITLSIENGYFTSNDVNLNTLISTYFDFKGGTNKNNIYVDTLDATTTYKQISLNLHNTINLNNSSEREEVISSVQSFLRNILFYNDDNKDAKFTFTFSELEMKLYLNNNSNVVDVVAFQSPENTKEHYYVKIEDNGIDWDDAYSTAAGLKWNNLQGYLVTITSEEEHNFIYQSLGSIRGWMGAAAIENYNTITYNTTNINWEPAYNRYALNTNFGTDSNNDEIIKQYWRWVAGPEAGNLIFQEGSYTNFDNNEPNNTTYEWCGEYGHGETGDWNDYAVDYFDIEGYYVEFGGFNDDNPTVTPVSLTSTFKWKDYDFRNAKEKIEEKIDSINFNENTQEEEIKAVVDTALEETMINNATSRIINKKIVGNKLKFDIEITIGEGSNKEVYIINIEREISIAVPKTLDAVLNYLFILIGSIIGIIITIILLKSRKRI